VNLLLDHIGLEVADHVRSKTFYSTALAPLGIDLLMEVEGWAGFGSVDVQRNPSFWIHQTPGSKSPVHVAFRSDRRERVRAFHAAALAAGGRDNGAPGVRPHYHPDYYAAFVLDPDGHNIEAVCHDPA
jgi:catechol 2,3-dioxygenase-like lactoylglutathione lyase family enzyme